MPKIENEITKDQYAKALKKAAREKGENEFARQLDEAGWFYQRECRFHPTRKWRSDFIIADPGEINWVLGIEDSILVEIEGGVWTRGRHTRGSGFIKDCEKYNTAAAMGWRVFRFPTGMVEDGSAIKFLKENVWN